MRQIIIFILLVNVFAGCRPDSKCKRGSIQPHSIISIMECTPSIRPNERLKLVELKLTSSQSDFFCNAINNAPASKAGFVCCKYYLQLQLDQTIGIIVDNKSKHVIGFDLGKDMNSIETHSKTIRQIREIKEPRDSKFLYNLVMSLFRGDIQK